MDEAICLVCSDLQIINRLCNKRKGYKRKGYKRTG